MRKNLADMYNVRSRFLGTFERFGKKTAYKGPDIVTFVLSNVKIVRDLPDYNLEKGDQVTDHLWFTYGKRFKKIKNLTPGDLIEFDARVRIYTKGYKKDHFDYNLKYPSKVKRIGHDSSYDNTQSKKKSLEIQNNTKNINQKKENNEDWCKRVKPKRKYRSINEWF